MKVFVGGTALDEVRANTHIAASGDVLVRAVRATRAKAAESKNSEEKREDNELHFK